MQKLSIGCVLVLAASLLPGCATKAGTGAAIGAGTGAVLGAVIGHQSGNRAAGAAIGAAVGAGGGALIGNEMDKNDEQNAGPATPQPVNR